MQALILAGGRGMGLKPLTDDLPPPLLYLPGGTILDYLLYHVSLLPVEGVALLLQYRGDQIARHVGTRDDLHLIPQNAPFTMVGALASAADWVEGPTLVLHADYYFSTPLDYFIERVDPARPSFLLCEPHSETDVVEQAGAYVLPREAFRVAREIAGATNLKALHAALNEGGLSPQVLPLQGWARHIESPTDLLTVNRYLLTRWHEALHPRHAGPGYDALNFNWIAPDASVDDQFYGFFVTVGPDACVRESDLYNTLLLPGVDAQGIREQHAVLYSRGNAIHRLYAPAPESAWLVD